MSWTEWPDKDFRGLNFDELRVNEAFFSVDNYMDVETYLYSLTDECVKCPFRRLRTFAPNSSTVFRLNVARKLEMKLFDEDFGTFAMPNQTSAGSLWSDQPKLGQFGVYDLKVSSSKEVNFEVAKEPVNIYFCKNFPEI